MAITAAAVVAAGGIIGSSLQARQQAKAARSARLSQRQIASRELALRKQAQEFGLSIGRRGRTEFDLLRREFGVGQGADPRDELFRTSSRLLREQAAATGNIRGGGFQRGLGTLALDAAERGRARRFQEQAEITRLGLGALPGIFGIGQQAGQFGVGAQQAGIQTGLVSGVGQGQQLGSIFNTAGQGIGGAILGNQLGTQGRTGGGTSIQQLQGRFA